jgi:hypothetical protein
MASYLLYFCQNNKEYHFEIFISFLIHSSAFFICLSLLNIFKFPLILIFSFFNIFTYAVAPSVISFNDFQLGVFNPEILYFFNVGFFVFYVVYFFLLYFRLSNIKYLPYQEKYDLNKLQFILLALYILFLFVTIGINGIDEIVKSYTIGVFFLGYLSDYNSWFKNLILLFIISFEIISAMLSGLIFDLVYLTIFILVLIYLLGHLNKKVIYISIFLGSFLVYFAFKFSPVKTEYRSIDLSKESTISKLQIIYDLISKGSENTEDKSKNSETLWRLTYPMSAFSMVRAKTPSLVPYWEGESYYSVFFKFIPRFIWSDKPKENMGQVFGHRYNILDNNDTRTSMNTPIIAEAYMNFGITAIFFVFIFMGVITASIFYKQNTIVDQSNEMNNLDQLLTNFDIAIVSVIFIQWESNLSMMLGKIIILLIVKKMIQLLVIFPNSKIDKKASSFSRKMRALLVKNK